MFYGKKNCVVYNGFTKSVKPSERAQLLIAEEAGKQFGLRLRSLLPQYNQVSVYIGNNYCLPKIRYTENLVLEKGKLHVIYWLKSLLTKAWANHIMNALKLWALLTLLIRTFIGIQSRITTHIIRLTFSIYLPVRTRFHQVLTVHVQESMSLDIQKTAIWTQPLRSSLEDLRTVTVEENSHWNAILCILRTIQITITSRRRPQTRLRFKITSRSMSSL